MSDKISVDLAVRADADDYRTVVDEAADALIYHRPIWLDFLSRVLKNAEPALFIAREDGLAVAVLPAFLMRGPYGTVLNSLPYFGSHGDILISRRAREPLRIIKTLVHELDRFRDESNIDAVNVIAHPLAPRFCEVAATVGLAKWDSRIGQISRLSPASTRDEAVEQMFSACHKQARNSVRKALKQGFSIDVSHDETDWNALIEHHAIRMRQIGGYAKTPQECAVLRSRFKSDKDSRLYVARRDGAFVGGLLCLFYRDWVEYFMPVTVDGARAQEVARALIAEALVEARLDRRRFWNWGGTWKSQVGVHQFKRGWGAVDHIYGYYGAVAAGALATADPADVLASYPHFYVRPFVADR